MRALLVPLLLASVLTGCSAVPATPPEPARSAPLHAMFDEFFEAQLELDPILASSIGDDRYNDRFPVRISPQWRERFREVQRRFLERAQQFDPAALDEQDRFSLEIFRRARELALEGLEYPEHLLPLDQFNSTPSLFAQLGSGASLHPFRTMEDYEDFLQRIDGFVEWTGQAIANMREGAARGYVQPKVLMERTLPQLAAHVLEDPEQSIFWGPIRAFPQAIGPAERERLSAAWRTAISERLVPAYRRLHDFVRDEYLPKCRDTVGLSALPDGRDWYAYRVRLMTTTDLTPEQIHEIGLAEVARVQGEMRKVMQQVGFDGDLREFFAHLQSDPRFFWSTREELIGGYRDIKRRVDARLPQLFETLPKADYEVRPVEPFRERSASGGQYVAASEDGSRPGIFYANTYDLRARPKWAMEALSLHEGNPGHHFQITLQRERSSLPRFRRFGSYTAFVEGWGLYAESLGHELGLYKDLYQYFGMLDAELFRSIRLVVDTGLHERGWTRRQVLEYMQENSAAAEARRISETERYIAAPAQALAYKIGQLKIRELRTRAARALGPRFDVRKFHTAVLEDGALPLDVLERKIERWIAAQRAESPS